MPKIPIQQQPQILNAGSPVPIAGTGEARMEGEAISQFGRGLASFADAREKTKNLLAQVQMEEADSEFDTMTREAIDLARGQIKDNPGMFGDQARKDFVAAHKEKMTAIAERVENPLYKRMWLAKANQKLTAFGEEVGNEQWKNEVKFTGEKTQEIVNTHVMNAAKDPLKRDESIIRAQSVIDSVGDEIFAPVVKREMREGLSVRVDSAIVEQYKTDGKFELARKYIDSRPESFKERDKAMDAVDKAEYTYLTQERANKRFQDYEQDRYRKEVRLTNDATLGMKFFTDGTSPIERQKIMSQAEDLRFQGLLSPAVFTAMQNNWKQGSKDISAKTQVGIYSEALKGMSFIDSERKVQEAMMKNGQEEGYLSSKDGYALLGRLKALERNPEKKQLELDGEKVVRAAWKSSILDDPTLGPEYRTQMENAVYYYHQLTAKGISPLSAANEARGRYHKSHLIGIGKGVPVDVASDKDAIQKELAAYAPAYKEAEKNGNKEEMKRLKNRLVILTQQLNVLMENEQAQKAIKSPVNQENKEGGGMMDTLKKWLGGATQ